MGKRIYFSMMAAVVAFGMLAVSPAKTHVAKVSKADAQRVSRVDANVQKATKGLQSVNVLSTKQINKDASLVVSKMADGRCVKTIQRKNVLSRNAVRPMLSSAKAEAGQTFYEDFEGFNGTSVDSIPEGWVEESKVGTTFDPEAESNFTWKMESGVYTTPIDGVAFMGINWAHDPTTYASIEQDEWLITPAFTPNANESLIFQFAYHPAWTLFDMEAYAADPNIENPFIAENTHLEVYASTDDGANWALLFNSVDNAKKYSLDELWNDASSYVCLFENIVLPLSEYVGKSTKIAFRYVGLNGESVYIDKVEVRTPVPVASYLRPEGAFISGYTNFGYAYTYNANKTQALLAPGHVDLNWTNASNAESTMFQWSFNDEVSNETNLVTNTPNGYMYTVPELVASAEGAESPSSYLYFAESLLSGGSLYLGDGEYAGMGNFRIDNGMANWGFGYDPTGKKAMSDETWDGLFNRKGTYSSMHLGAVANYYGKPEKPYAISTMWVPAFFESTESAELKLELYKVIDGTMESEPFAQGYANLTDTLSLSSSAGFFNFHFTKVDPETGLDEDVDYVEVDEAMIAVISGFDSSEFTWSSFPCQDVFNEDGECNAYMMLDVVRASDSAEGSLVYPMSNLVTSDGALNVSFPWFMDVDYTWMEPETYRVQLDEANVPTRVYVDCGWVPTVDYEGTTYYIWEVPEDADYDGAIDEAPWLVYNLGREEVVEGGEVVDEKFYIDFAASSVEPRYADVTLHIPAADATIRVIQGDGGVKAVASDAVKVSVAGGNFNIKANAGVNSVAIYTVAGQLVKKAALVAGDNVVPASDLAKGVYVLKFNNNYAVKAVK